MLQPMVLKSYEKYFFTKFDRKYQVLPDVSQKIKFEKKITLKISARVVTNRIPFMKEIYCKCNFVVLSYILL